MSPIGEDYMLHKWPHLTTLFEKICGTNSRHVAQHSATLRHLPQRGGKIPNEVVPLYHIPLVVGEGLREEKGDNST